ncbi:MAG: hypothetical protein H6852_02060 [Geminicoccaceae bacterium]|jgi:hypothetical protein|nr:hypothetical protein [Geminicoccaceae bacterium]MCB9966406.1 hypothetical protein [Geminicoccaceae bacterium]HRY22968.1 hypothetical protein [Geminicoccaceae bacterium]
MAHHRAGAVGGLVVMRRVATVTRHAEACRTVATRRAMAVSSFGATFASRPAGRPPLLAASWSNAGRSLVPTGIPPVDPAMSLRRLDR